MALESTPDEIKAFLEQLAAQAEITDFIQNLGRDLVASGVLRAEELSLKRRSLLKNKETITWQ